MKNTATPKGMPSPPALIWTAESVFGVGLDRVEVTALSGSVTGNNVARMRFESGAPVVVKELTGNWSLAREASAVVAAQSVDGVTRYVAHDEDMRILVTGYVPRLRETWNEKYVLSALKTLAGLPAVLDRSGLPVMGRHEGDWKRAQLGAELLEAAYPAEAALGLKSWETLRSHGDGELVAGHGDATPTNWILYSHPVLIDFGAVSLTPRGWDEAALLAFLPMSPARRAAYAKDSTGGQAMLLLASSAMLLIAVEARQHPGTEYCAWGEKYMPPLLALTSYLLED